MTGQGPKNTDNSCNAISNVNDSTLQKLHVNISTVAPNLITKYIHTLLCYIGDRIICLVLYSMFFKSLFGLVNINIKADIFTLFMKIKQMLIGICSDLGDETH